MLETNLPCDFGQAKHGMLAKIFVGSVQVFMERLKLKGADLYILTFCWWLLLGVFGQKNENEGSAIADTLCLPRADAEHLKRAEPDLLDNNLQLLSDLAVLPHDEARTFSS